jgi:hypothetical protein
MTHSLVKQPGWQTRHTWKNDSTRGKLLVARRSVLPHIEFFNSAMWCAVGSSTNSKGAAMQVRATLFQLGTDLKKAPTRNAKAPQSRQAQAEGFDNTGVGSFMRRDTDALSPAFAGTASAGRMVRHSRREVARRFLAAIRGFILTLGNAAHVFMPADLQIITAVPDHWSGTSHHLQA